MQSANNNSGGMAIPGESGISREQLDLIWLMAVGNFSSTNNTVIIPKDLAVRLSHENIEDLKLRFR